MSHRHNHLPPIFRREITWEGTSLPDVKVYYAIIDEHCIIYNQREKQSYVREGVTYYRWIVIYPTDSRWGQLRSLFDEIEQVWHGDHERWNLDTSQKEILSNYGSTLVPPATGFEVLLDSLIPLVDNWLESPLDGWVMVLDYLPTIIITVI